MTVVTDTIFWWEDTYQCEAKETFVVTLLSETEGFSIGLSINSRYNCNRELVPTYCLAIYIEPFVYGLQFHRAVGQFVTDTTSDIRRYRQHFYERLEIQSKIYYNVVEYILYVQFSNQQDLLPRRLLYNKTYGILQLEEKDKMLFAINH